MEAETLADQTAQASPPGCDGTQGRDPEARPAQDDRRFDEPLDRISAQNIIYFDYNDAAIRGTSKAVLEDVAALLQKAPGHVSDRRAFAMCADRPNTICISANAGYETSRSTSRPTASIRPASPSFPYGEERPVDLGMSEGPIRRTDAELKRQ